MSIERNLENISSDEAALDAKIERRRREFEQQQKRLAKLQVCWLEANINVSALSFY